jgi:hypothetical protein
MKNEIENHLAFNSEHRLRTENLAFDIDVWYPKLEKFTFPTIFLPLTLKDSKAIVDYYNFIWRNIGNELTFETANSLLDLERYIDDNIKILFKNSNGNTAFCRLCGRSPKDGEPWDRKKVLEDYHKAYDSVIQSKGISIDESTANDKMIAISQVTWLSVQNGREALQLLLTSERVYSDMIDRLKFGEPDQIAVRIWEPRISMQFEFRLFVSKGKLTAISQYDHYAYYPDLHSKKDWLSTGLYNY